MEEEKGEKRRSWWDEECKEGKRRIRRELRKWRREEGGGEKYRIERLKYKGEEEGGSGKMGERNKGGENGGAGVEDSE